jgi:transcriptional antiterminator NusG
MIFVVKVTTNKEDQAADMIAERAKKKQLPVYSIIRPHGLRGYILLEAFDHETAEEAVFNLPYVKNIITKTVSYDDIKNLLEYTPAAMKIEQGDIVEIIAEPFKKEKAKVIRIDKAKEEAVVELLGAAVPIPVTVKLDNVRVIRREKEEQAKAGEGAEQEASGMGEVSEPRGSDDGSTGQYAGEKELEES